APAARNRAAIRVAKSFSMSLSSSLETQSSDIEGHGLSAVLELAAQREAEVQLDGDVPELRDEEAEAEADGAAPLLALQAVDVRRQASQVEEEGAAEEFHEDGEGVLRRRQHQRVSADGFEVLVGAHAAVVEAAGPVASSRVEALEDGEVRGPPHARAQ